MNKSIFNRFLSLFVAMTFGIMQPVPVSFADLMLTPTDDSQMTKTVDDANSEAPLTPEEEQAKKDLEEAMRTAAGYPPETLTQVDEADEDSAAKTEVIYPIHIREPKEPIEPAPVKIEIPLVKPVKQDFLDADNNLIRQVNSDGSLLEIDWEQKEARVTDTQGNERHFEDIGQMAVSGSTCDANPEPGTLCPQWIADYMMVEGYESFGSYTTVVEEDGKIITTSYVITGKPAVRYPVNEFNENGQLVRQTLEDRSVIEFNWEDNTAIKTDYFGEQMRFTNIMRTTGGGSACPVDPASTDACERWLARPFIPIGVDHISNATKRNFEDGKIVERSFGFHGTPDKNFRSYPHNRFDVKGNLISQELEDGTKLEFNWDDKTAEVHHPNGNITYYKNINAHEMGGSSCPLSSGGLDFACVGWQTMFLLAEGATDNQFAAYRTEKVIDGVAETREYIIFGEVYTKYPENVFDDEGQLIKQTLEDGTVIEFNWDDKTAVMTGPDGKVTKFEDIKLVSTGGSKCPANPSIGAPCEAWDSLIAFMGEKEIAYYSTQTVEDGWVTNESFMIVGFEAVDDIAEYPTHLMVKGKAYLVDDMQFMVDVIQMMADKARRASGQICFEGCGTAADLLLLRGVKQLLGDRVYEFDSYTNPRFMSPPVYTKRGWVEFLEAFLTELDNAGVDYFDSPVAPARFISMMSRSYWSSQRSTVDVFGGNNLTKRPSELIILPRISNSKVWSAIENGIDETPKSIMQAKAYEYLSETLGLSVDDLKDAVENMEIVFAGHVRINVKFKDGQMGPPRFLDVAGSGELPDTMEMFFSSVDGSIVAESLELSHINSTWYEEGGAYVSAVIKMAKGRIDHVSWQRTVPGNNSCPEGQMCLMVYYPDIRTHLKDEKYHYQKDGSVRIEVFEKNIIESNVAGLTIAVIDREDFVPMPSQVLFLEVQADDKHHIAAVESYNRQGQLIDRTEFQYITAVHDCLLGHECLPAISYLYRAVRKHESGREFVWRLTDHNAVLEGESVDVDFMSLEEFIEKAREAEMEIMEPSVPHYEQLLSDLTSTYGFNPKDAKRLLDNAEIVRGKDQILSVIINPKDIMATGDALFNPLMDMADIKILKFNFKIELVQTACAIFDDGTTGNCAGPIEVFVLKSAEVDAGDLRSTISYVNNKPVSARNEKATNIVCIKAPCPTHSLISETSISYDDKNQIKVNIAYAGNQASGLMSTAVNFVKFDNRHFVNQVTDTYVDGEEILSQFNYMVALPSVYCEQGAHCEMPPAYVNLWNIQRSTGKDFAEMLSVIEGNSITYKGYESTVGGSHRNKLNQALKFERETDQELAMFENLQLLEFLEVTRSSNMVNADRNYKFQMLGTGQIKIMIAENPCPAPEPGGVTCMAVGRLIELTIDIVEGGDQFVRGDFEIDLNEDRTHYTMKFPGTITFRNLRHYAKFSRISESQRLVVQYSGGQAYIDWDKEVEGKLVRTDIRTGDSVEFVEARDVMSCSYPANGLHLCAGIAHPGPEFEQVGSYKKDLPDGGYEERIIFGRRADFGQLKLTGTLREITGPSYLQRTAFEFITNDSPLGDGMNFTIDGVSPEGIAEKLRHAIMVNGGRVELTFEKSMDLEGIELYRVIEIGGVPVGDYKMLSEIEIGGKVYHVNLMKFVEAVDGAAQEAFREYMAAGNPIAIHGEPPHTYYGRLKGISDVLTDEDFTAFWEPKTPVQNNEPVCNDEGICMVEVMPWSDATPFFNVKEKGNMMTELIKRFADKEQDIFDEDGELSLQKILKVIVNGIVERMYAGLTKEQALDALNETFAGHSVDVSSVVLRERGAPERDLPHVWYVVFSADLNNDGVNEFYGIDISTGGHLGTFVNRDSMRELVPDEEEPFIGNDPPAPDLNMIVVDGVDYEVNIEAMVQAIDEVKRAAFDEFVAVAGYPIHGEPESVSYRRLKAIGDIFTNEDFKTYWSPQEISTPVCDDNGLCQAVLPPMSSPNFDATEKARMVRALLEEMIKRGYEITDADNKISVDSVMQHMTFPKHQEPEEKEIDINPIIRKTPEELIDPVGGSTPITPLAQPQVRINEAFSTSFTEMPVPVVKAAPTPPMVKAFRSIARRFKRAFKI